MSDHSLKRPFFFCILVVLAVGSAFASTPSARYQTKMVWDPAIHRAVLFGGLTSIDAGTKLQYELPDTWEWTGTRWFQVFPTHSPSARAAESMVFDSARNRVVIFGGRQGKLNLNDTWSFDGKDWAPITTTSAPSVREVAGAAYDSTRDRIVLFGGMHQTYSADGKTLTETPLHDTWEFNGTNWTQLLTDGPAVTKPILEYDQVRKQTIMLGVSASTNATVMYAWDPAAATWKSLTPSVLPTCANEGVMTWQSSNNTILYTGGICATTTTTEETYEWDGTNWTKITLSSFAGPYVGSTLTFDSDRQVAVLFGGAPAAGALSTGTFTYANKAWTGNGDVAYPVPRSLFTFASDPVNKVIYLFGGVDDATSFVDFWTYANGTFRSQISSQPTDCTSPLGAFDTDRSKLVVLCGSALTWEYDGSTWTQFTASKTAPPGHRFGSLVYDQSLKKTVYFGGFDVNGIYLDQTWTFDGTGWTQVKKNPAPSRSLTSMWYDPILKKTVIYGGLGRVTSTDRLTRYSDMWSFDGTGWTQIKPDVTPGMRYGAQVGVDPKTGHAILFGGIRVDIDANNNQVQVYANDTWEWDGTTWKKITSALTPPPRENAGFAVDPIRNQLVMFGGYSGFYLSDVWTFANGNWSPITETVNRRRATR